MIARTIAANAVVVIREPGKPGGAQIGLRWIGGECRQRIEAAVMDIFDHSQRIEAGERLAQHLQVVPRCRISGEIRLGDDDAVCQLDLSPALGMALEVGSAVHRVDDGDDRPRPIEAADR